MSRSELRARTCIVTGADGGLGRAIAVALAAAGATVYEAGPGGAEDAEALARDLLEREEGIDVLVHSAGTTQATDIRAASQLTQALLPRLRANDGQVVFVNSTAALTTTSVLTASWNSLRRVLSPQGVRVMSVYAPGRLREPEDVASVVLRALTRTANDPAMPDLALR